MAVAFYIPDQATLLRKASEQEQKILRMRETHWRYFASVLVDALRQYVEATPNYRLARSGSGRRRCGGSSSGGKDKSKKNKN